MNKLYDKYVATQRKYADLEHSIAILSWDKEVNGPPKGRGVRAQQFATLSGIAHEIITNANHGEVLESLAIQKETLNDKQLRNIKVSLKNFQRSTKLSKDFVIRRSNAVSKAYDKWLAAREANDYSIFESALQRMIEIKREEAELVGYDDHPYDALLDEYEPGAKAKALDLLFKDVKAQLVTFAQNIKSKTDIDNSFLRKFYQKDKQWQFGLDLLKNMGYDFSAGRQDISPHPFTTSFGATDVRVTTRIDENDFGNMTWSCIHEGGHALYEQGLLVEEYGLPSGKYISLGIHESQSRLWENNVGRSLEYWKAHYPKLQQMFPENLSSVSLEQFYQGINKVAPSFIRTESDEIHYHFHILIRYELEKMMLEGTQANELRDLWNDKYLEYLGVTVPDDNRGILQDIHWSYGSIGYFPTYSLGSFYAAQFFHQAEQDIPGLKEQITQGDNSQLLDWLRDKIHKFGHTYEAEELCEVVTGEKLNFKYFMKYATEKFDGI